ncbi:ribosome biogenesis protein [Candidatus Woesearchaeota archaeon]|nr:ribosome biogenesis protein [Candidatus Woesearchaeota archaeon]
MAKHILKCIGCQKYTMNEHCSCGGKAVSPKPAKYSPEDKYGHMRREVKKKELIEKGLL